MDYTTIKAAVTSNSAFNDLYIIEDDGSFFGFAEKYGLILNAGSPKIGKAQPVKMLVSVPGGGLLNLSRAIDGYVHYKSREIIAEFSCFRPRSEIPAIRKELEKLHGQWRQFFFRHGPICWAGQLNFTLSENEHKATVTMTAVCNPYGNRMTAYMGNNWLWDSFDFENDTISDTKSEVNSL